jgi:hypothetical protein
VLIKDLSKLLARKNNLLRGLSAVAAIAVLIWSVIWPPVAAWLRADQILTIHSVDFDNTYPGGVLRLNWVITKTRADCDVKTNFAFYDSTGAFMRLYDDGAPAPSGEYRELTILLTVPELASPGAASMMVGVRYSHPTDRSCNQFYEFGPYPFTILRSGSHGRRQ